MRYLLSKLVIFFISLFCVITLTFFLMHTIPGDPFMQEQAVPEEIMKSMYVHYGLDQPLHIQYLKYLKGVITFDFGPSFKYEGRAVIDIIKEGFPVSAILGLEALTLALCIGIPLGTIAAAFHNRWQDNTAMVLAVMGLSIPNFILATSLQYVFCT